MGISKAFIQYHLELVEGTEMLTQLWGIAVNPLELLYQSDALVNHLSSINTYASLCILSWER